MNEAHDAIIVTENPATGQVIASYTVHTASEVSEAIELADRRHQAWRRESFADRAARLMATADRLDARSDELAALMADEMGKPVVAGRAEVAKCAFACRHYAATAEAYLADRHIDADRTRSYVHHEPLGVILAVMPWNFPLWQVVRFAAPALMAGNGALLKHASSVTGTALALEEVFAEAELPEGLFTTLVVPSSRVAGIVEDELVRAVTLTGSGPAGSSVAATAGRLLKKTVLELGGSDPYVVLADADLDLAATSCATSRLINGGQSCIAAKRFIVDGAVYDEFVERVAVAMSEVVMGDPHDEATGIGPLARTDLRDELDEQVRASVAAGARLVLGGEVPDRPGAWYPPTLLADVRAGMAAYDEETFGPVGAVIRAEGEDEAIRMANDTDFGLGAAIFTADVEKGEHLAATRLDAGNCVVNGIVTSDPRLPFGGIKDSGFGRELADLGIKEFVNAKTVVVV